MVDRFSPTSNQVVWQTWHEPFGAAVALDEDPDGDGDNVVLNLRFSRQYYDAETGLHYNWHRFYDPQAGRYLHPDPVRRQRGGFAMLRTFSYVGNNPMIFTDILGLEVDIFIWDPAEGDSRFGHASICINDRCYDFVADGILDALWPYEKKSDMNIFTSREVFLWTRNHFFPGRGANIYLLKLSPEQENIMSHFLDTYPYRYSLFSRTCTVPIIDALGAAGAPVPFSLFPQGFEESIKKHPNLDSPGRYQPPSH